MNEEGNGNAKPYEPSEFRLLKEALTNGTTIDEGDTIRRLIATLECAAADTLRHHEKYSVMAQALAGTSWLLGHKMPVPTQTQAGQSIYIIPKAVLRQMDKHGELSVYETSNSIKVTWREPKKLIQISREMPKESDNE